MGIIEINHLSKSYGKARGIVDVSLSIHEGEIFGFIGPNGAGKSTTIRCILNLIHPDEGNAMIMGMDSQSQSVEILKEVGYLPSEVFYYENMRVKDLLNYSASFYKKDCTAKIKELSEYFELNLNQKIDECSYGNKKKVGIIQGLLHSPKLIILDEPTGGLDPLMQKKFFDLIKQENKKGTTILFSSHILSEVQNVCDRVAIIKEGKIVQVEKISALRENSYKKVYLEGNIKQLILDLPGISNVQQDENTLEFLFQGNINALTKWISSLELRNCQIIEPDLEEIFMHYYQEEKPHESL